MLYSMFYGTLYNTVLLQKLLGIKTQYNTLLLDKKLSCVANTMRQYDTAELGFFSECGVI